MPSNKYQFARKPVVSLKRYVCVVGVLHHASVMEGGREDEEDEER